MNRITDKALEQEIACQKIEGGLASTISALLELQARRRNDAIVAELLVACKAMTPRAGHPVECMEPNPTEEWAEKGSWNADKCACGIKQAHAAIQKAEEAGIK